MKKRSRKIFVASILAITASLFVAGCTGVQYAMTPYKYQFSSPEVSEVCLKVDPESSVAMSYEVRRAIEEHGLKVREVNNDEDASGCVSCVRFHFEFGGWSKCVLQKASLELTSTVNSRRNTVRVVSKLENTEKVLNEDPSETTKTIHSLVDQLFPQPIPWVAE